MRAPARAVISVLEAIVSEGTGKQPGIYPPALT